MFFDQFKQVKGIVLDVDGVLTNGSILISESGQQLRSYNVKDGYAIQLAVKRGFHVVIISGGLSKSIITRFESLGVTDIYTGVYHKVEVLEQWMKLRQLRQGEVLYMGDDIPDLKASAMAGIAVCPADAVEEIKAIACYISPKKGGEGVVRDVLEKVLKLQGKWDNDASIKSN